MSFCSPTFDCINSHISRSIFNLQPLGAVKKTKCSKGLFYGHVEVNDIPVPSKVGLGGTPADAIHSCVSSRSPIRFAIIAKFLA